MKLAISYYTYLYFVSKIFKKRIKEFNNRTETLGLFSLLVILLFFIALFSYLFEIKWINNLLNKGLPLGPISMVIAFIILFFYHLIFKPKINSKVINDMRIARNKTAHIKREWSILFLILIFVLFFGTIVLFIINNSFSRL